MKSGRHEAQIVKADYLCVNLNTQILKYLAAIRRGVQLQIKADY